MKSTGIVRRIDDLGRVVIPKEIRRCMNIKEGDCLEIYTDRITNAVIFQKYQPNPCAKLIEVLDIIEEDVDSNEMLRTTANMEKAITNLRETATAYYREVEGR